MDSSYRAGDGNDCPKGRDIFPLLSLKKCEQAALSSTIILTKNIEIQVKYMGLLGYKKGCYFDIDNHTFFYNPQTFETPKDLLRNPKLELKMICKKVDDFSKFSMEEQDTGEETKHNWQNAYRRQYGPIHPSILVEKNYFGSKK